MSDAVQVLDGLSAEDKRALLARLLHRRARQPKSFPLSFSQQRLWFLHQMDPTDSAYNVGTAVRLRGNVRVAVLAAGMREIARRHETLRTTFETRHGEPVQVVDPQPGVEMPVVDLSALPPRAREERAKKLVHEQSRMPFDLERGPLLRVTLLRCADDELVMSLWMHHVISDGWSMGILIRELVQLYGFLVEGSAQRAGPPPLPELPIQYADFAQWQRDWLRDGVLAAQLDYWRRQLGDSPPVLELPFDRPRPAVQTSRGGVFATSLGPALSDRLRALCQQRKVTLFMALLAAFETLLRRFSGQDAFAVGTPIANRHRLETEGLIGFFANTLVLRADLSGDPSFRSLLERVKEVILGAHDHQDLPFERLVEELQPVRSVSHSPLFQVVFTWRDTVQVEDLDLPHLTLSPFDSGGGAAQFDLTLDVSDQPRGIQTAFVYNADLFDRTTLRRLAASYRTLLESIAADPEQRLSELSVEGPSQRHQILFEWNDEPLPPPPREASLQALFEARAALAPDAVALVFDPLGQAPGEDRIELSYRQLNRAANRLAHHLRDLGVGADVPVALCLERSPDLAVGILGILKAGGAYLPLDASHPAERLRRVLEDAFQGIAAPVVVTRDALGSELPVPAGTRFVRLDADRRLLARRPDGDPAPLASAETSSYVIFTSGSTGRPKGVVVSHANVTSLLAACEARFALGPEDVWTLFHSYAFDFSVWELWGALAFGGRLVVVPRETTHSPEALHELLLRERVTVLNQTPTVFRALSRVDRPVAARPVAARAERTGELPLRCVIFGGEALDFRALRSWYANRPDPDGGPRLVNMYGITETTVHVTQRWLSHRDTAEPAASVVGRALPHLRVYLLDASRRPAPMGVAGEIHVGGTGLARGYLGRPRLTAERFVPDPFTGPPGARLYRSGDLARFLPRGDLEYLGRMDHQVKLRGFRIELGEIESCLGQHPAVSGAAVTLRDDLPGDERLVAYVVTRPADGREEVGVGQLREFVSQRLPEYMIPSTVVFLPALPLTVNGKVDRRALPAPPEGREALGEDYVPPHDRIERTIADIWQEVLRVESVGRNDNFFELGGHSLLIVQVRNRLREALGRDLPLVELFRHPTVSALAGHLGGESAAAEIGGRGEELAGGKARLRQRLQRRQRS